MFHGKSKALNPGEGERTEKRLLPTVFVENCSSAVGKPEKDEQLFYVEFQ